MEKTETEETRTIEKTITVVVDKVFVGSEKVVVESSSSSVEVSTSEQISDETVPVVSHDEGKEGEESSKVSDEIAAEPEKQHLPTDTTSTVDETDATLSDTTTESSVTVVETVTTSMEVSETVETSTVVSVVETDVQSSLQTSDTDQLKLEVKEEASGRPGTTPSETSSTVPLESEPPEAAVPEESCSPPMSPSKTKWYFSLDRKQTWTVTPEREEEKSLKSPKSKTNDRGSIKSTSSDTGSIKSLSAAEGDELMMMCRNIKRARLSIVGEPVWDGEQRMRAFSSRQDSDKAMVKLKTLERSLKVG